MLSASAVVAAVVAQHPLLVNPARAVAVAVVVIQPNTFLRLLRHTLTR
jgi:hypothetical protein